MRQGLCLSLSIALLAATAAPLAGARQTSPDAPAVDQGPTVWFGQIGLFAGYQCPNNWLPANGQVFEIHEYEVLYSIFGDRYGGDGRETFGLPDLRGRMPADAGGVSNRKVGERIGSEHVLLVADNIAPHSHHFMASADGPDTRDPQHASLATFPPSASAYAETSTLTGTMNDGVLEPMSDPAPRAFSIQQPTLAMMFCVANTGVYPRRPR